MAICSLVPVCILLFASYGNAMNTETEVSLKERLLRLEERLEQQEIINKLQAETIRQLDLKVDQQQETIRKQEEINHRHEGWFKLQENAGHRFGPNQEALYWGQEKKTETHQRVNDNTFSKYRRSEHLTNPLSPVQRITRQYERVAFSSYLDHNVENIGLNQAIVYNRLLLNEGSAYNNSSGMFTCPMDGIYGFYFSVATQDINQIVAKLVVDNVNQVDGVSDTFHDNHEAQGGNFVFVSLLKGQQVWVANYRWTTHSMQETDYYRFSTFSGFLLY